MKNTKNDTGNICKQTQNNRKILERGKITTPNTQIYDRSVFWLGTGT